MKIIYGVVGEGMGHATRSRVILEHLHEMGHDIVVVVSGRAHGFLTTKLKDKPRIRVEEIHGSHLKYDGNDLDLAQSILSNVVAMPEGFKKNISRFVDLLQGFKADAVISDFESFAWFYARLNSIPVISIDNMQVMNRCVHDDFASDDESFAFRLAKFAVKSKLPGCYHYLVSSFFFPPVRKHKTNLIPPILRPEILSAKREPKDHILVYQTAGANAEHLIATLKSLPWQSRVYGTGKTGVFDNVTCCPFSETQFVDDLRTARCVIAGGGYSLMGEAVHLHVPLLSIPIQGQYEQELNARYLQKLGYGRYAEKVEAEVIRYFVNDAPNMQIALEKYQPQDNSMLFGCLDELLRDISQDEPPKDFLNVKTMGHYDSSLELNKEMQSILKS